MSSNILPVPVDPKKIIQKYDVFTEYVKWFICPDCDKVPQTQKEFASINDISEVTLWRWRSESPYMEVFSAMRDELRMKFLKKYTSQVDSNLIKKATKSDAKAVDLELFYKIVEGYGQKPDTQINILNVIGNMSDEELNKRAREIADQIREEENIIDIVPESIDNS